MPVYEYPDAFQEYVETILRLTQESPEGLVTNLAIATDLQVKPPSVTEMLGKLQDHGLVEWEKRKGVKLTDKGLNLAKHIIRNHFVLKILFNKLFGIEDDDILEQLACDIEHHLTRKVMQSMEAALGTEDIDTAVPEVYDIEFIKKFDSLRVVNVAEVRRKLEDVAEEFAGDLPDQAEQLKAKLQEVLDNIFE
ncbi:MAG TPA: metal-dependent transcriptional regulator [Candidatus Lokiarchaeia archaeon]|nr:metal-dependent transcriptional regulator [Candidatus Lokiarchaeia archaeon]